jgi:hypothetical protein
LVWEIDIALNYWYNNKLKFYVYFRITRKVFNMKAMKILAGFLAAAFAVLGIATAALGIYVSFQSIGVEPVLLETPEAAINQVTVMLDKVQQGDFNGAGAMMQGSPDLGVDRDASDAVGVLIWEAFVDSFTYELVGDCYATDSGVAQDLRITCLEISSVTVSLRERSQSKLEQRVAEAEDISEVYDEENNYREDVVMAVLYEAAQDALAQDAKTVTYELTVNLIHDEDQWRIIPDDALLKAISGGILK